MRNRSILEGLDEILTMPWPAARTPALACLQKIENALGTVRQVTRQRQTLEERRDGAQMDRRRLAEAQKTFRRLKAYRQLPILRNALQEHLRKAHADSAIETIMKAA